MKDQRSALQIKIAAAKRLAMWHFGNKPLNLVLLTEYPKSGGTWLGQMLADYLQIPFPRNRSPKIERCLMHAHLPYNQRFKGKLIALHRDGRDVLVSLYYHLFFENEHNPSYFVKKMRNLMPFDDYDNIKANLPAFIEQISKGIPQNGLNASWGDFTKSFEGTDTITISYESLLQDTAAAMANLIKKYTKQEPDMGRITNIVARYNFDAQKKVHEKEKTTEKSFLRNGKSGDWVNHFDRKSAEVFDKYNGDQLVKLGYESNRNWWRNL